MSLIEEYYEVVVIHCNKSLRMFKYKVEWKVEEDTAEGRLSNIEELVVIDNIGVHPDPNTDSANQPQLKARRRHKKKKTSSLSSMEVGHDVVQLNLAALEGNGEDGAPSRLDVEGTAEIGLGRQIWTQLRQAATSDAVDLDARVDQARLSAPASQEFDGIALDEALLDALNAPVQADDAMRGHVAAALANTSLAAWEDACHEAQQVWNWRASSSHLPLGGRYQYNMSLVEYIPAAGAPPTTGLVHWADPNTWTGKIVRCVGNRLITITPMMDPTIDLSRHGLPTVVAPDVGERGDRRQPKDIRIPLPPLVNRLNRMWLAGLQPSISAVPCTVCGQVQKDDDVSFVCCNCLLTWHADCADQTNDILQAMLVPATPRYPPDGFPVKFHEVLCKLCGSLWAPREQQARMLKS